MPNGFWSATAKFHLQKSPIGGIALILVDPGKIIQIIDDQIQVAVIVQVGVGSAI